MALLKESAPAAVWEKINVSQVVKKNYENSQLVQKISGHVQGHSVIHCTGYTHKIDYVLNCLQVHDDLVKMVRSLMAELRFNNPDFIEAGKFRELMSKCNQPQFISDEEIELAGGGD